VAAKELACGCAGAYTAHAALQLYAEAFESSGALDKLGWFSSFHGCDHHGLPMNEGKVVLEKGSWVVPERYRFGSSVLRTLRVGGKISWSIVDQ